VFPQKVYAISYFKSLEISFKIWYNERYKSANSREYMEVLLMTIKHIMSEEEITQRIKGKEQSERFAFLAAVADIQSITATLSDEECKLVRKIAAIAEIVIRQQPEDQKTMLAMLSTGIVASESVSSMMRRFNPST